MVPLASAARAAVGIVFLGTGAVLFLITWSRMVGIAWYAVTSGHPYSDVTAVYGGTALLELLAVILTILRKGSSADQTCWGMIRRLTQVLWACFGLSYVLLGFLVFSGVLW